MLIMNELVPGSIIIAHIALFPARFIICHIQDINTRSVIYRWSSWKKTPDYIRREYESFRDLRMESPRTEKHYSPAFYEELHELYG